MLIIRNMHCKLKTVCVYLKLISCLLLVRKFKKLFPSQNGKNYQNNTKKNSTSASHMFGANNMHFLTKLCPACHFRLQCLQDGFRIKELGSFVFAIAMHFSVIVFSRSHHVLSNSDKSKDCSLKLHL